MPRKTARKYSVGNQLNPCIPEGKGMRGRGGRQSIITASYWTLGTINYCGTQSIITASYWTLGTDQFNKTLGTNVIRLGTNVIKLWVPIEWYWVISIHVYLGGGVTSPPQKKITLQGLGIHKIIFILSLYHIHARLQLNQDKSKCRALRPMYGEIRHKTMMIPGKTKIFQWGLFEKIRFKISNSIFIP